MDGKERAQDDIDEVMSFPIENGIKAEQVKSRKELLWRNNPFHIEHGPQKGR